MPVDRWLMKKEYQTDLTDTEWQIIERMLPPLPRRGRPALDRRSVCNALFYLVRAGCSWRLLPRCYGNWSTIYNTFQRWNKRHTFHGMHTYLVQYMRKLAKRKPQPTAAIVDSQSYKSSDHAGLRGYDAAKKISGRKRHVIVDTLGLILALKVTPASIQDRQGLAMVMDRCLEKWHRLQVLFADAGYNGLATHQWVKSQRPRGKLHLEIVRSPCEQRGFSVQPKRWVVERTFAWINKYRRLVRDYEVKTSTSEGLLYVAMISSMVRKLAKSGVF